jgi:hypothetical protein
MTEFGGRQRADNDVEDNQGCEMCINAFAAIYDALLYPSVVQ